MSSWKGAQAGNQLQFKCHPGRKPVQGTSFNPNIIPCITISCWEKRYLYMLCLTPHAINIGFDPWCGCHAHVTHIHVVICEWTRMQYFYCDVSCFFFTIGWSFLLYANYNNYKLYYFLWLTTILQKQLRNCFYYRKTCNLPTCISATNITMTTKTKIS